MKTHTRIPLRKRWRVGLLPFVVALVVAGVATASGGSFTTTFHIEETVVDTNPCGGTATVSLQYRGVYHESWTDKGAVVFHLTAMGTWQGPEDGGTFTLALGGKDGLRNSGFSSNSVIRGSDFVWHVLTQFRMSATGEVTVDFTKVTC